MISLRSSIAKETRAFLAPSVPSIAYKPSENCAYSMLINKIREKQTILPLLGLDSKASSDTSRSPPSTCTSSRSNSPVPVETDVPSPSQVLTKVAVAESVMISKSAVISGAPEYYNPEDGCSDTEDELVPATNERNIPPESSMPVAPPPPDISAPPLLIPEPALKLIIDKLVLYVAKNGRDFEIVVKRKCDPRFSFLEPGDKHNAYYEKELKALLPTDSAPTQQVTSSNGEADSSQKQSLLRFSIKKPRAEKAIPAADTKVKCALEDSSDEDKEGEGPPSPPPPPLIIPPPPVISSGASVSAAASDKEAAPPPPTMSGSDLAQSRTGRLSVELEEKSRTSGGGGGGGGGGETDEKKAERKRRAEVFLKMLRTSSQPAQPTSSLPTDEVEHVATVHKNSNGSQNNIAVINIPDSDESESATRPPLDLKAKLRALRTHSMSPSAPAPPPPKIRKLKSSRHKHSKRSKRASRSRSPPSSSEDSDRSSSKRSKSSRKKLSRREDALSPPKRSHRDKKAAKKKKKKREDDASPPPAASKKSKSHHKSKSHKRRRSHSRSQSPRRSHSSAKSKSKRRKSADSSDESGSYD